MCNFPKIVTNSFIGRIEGLLVHFRRLFCNIFNCVWQECAINHVTKLELADFTVYWALSSAFFHKAFTFGLSSAWICSYFMLFSSPPALQAIYNIGLSNLVCQLSNQIFLNESKKKMKRVVFIFMRQWARQAVAFLLSPTMEKNAKVLKERGGKKRVAKSSKN